MGWLIAAGLAYLWLKNQPSTASAIASAGNAATQAGAALQTVATDITGSPIAPNQANVAPSVLSDTAMAPLPGAPQIVSPLPVAPRVTLPVSAQRFALTGGVRQLMEME